MTAPEKTGLEPEAVFAVVPAEAASLTRVCGLTLLERTLRSLARAGVRRAIVVSSRPDVLEQASRSHWSRRSLQVAPRRRTTPQGRRASMTVGELEAVRGGRDCLY